MVSRNFWSHFMMYASVESNDFHGDYAAPKQHPEVQHMSWKFYRAILSFLFGFQDLFLGNHYRFNFWHLTYLFYLLQYPCTVATIVCFDIQGVYMWATVQYTYKLWCVLHSAISSIRSSLSVSCTLVCIVNSRWPSEAKWRHESWSMSVQVINSLPTTQSHYLNQC